MEILYIERNWDSAYSQISTLKTKEGKVKAIISSSINQPKMNQPTIKITKLGKTVEYQLNWSRVENKK